MNQIEYIVQQGNAWGAWINIQTTDTLEHARELAANGCGIQPYFRESSMAVFRIVERTYSDKIIS